MSKKERNSGGGNNLKIIIFNIIIAALCIASIVTLYVGDFMKAEITLTVNKDTLVKMMPKQESAPQNGAIKAAGEEGGFNMGDITKYLDDDFELSFSASFALKGDSIAKSALGNADQEVKGLINDNIDKLIDNITATVDQVVEQSMKAVVRAAVDEIKATIKEAIKEGMEGSDVTEEEVWEMLNEKGIYETDIDRTIDEFAATIEKLLEGDRTETIAFLESTADTSVLYKMECIAAEEELKSSGNSYTQADIEAKASEYQKQIVAEFNKVIDELSVDGQFSTETLIVSLFNGFGFEDENATDEKDDKVEDIENGPANAAEEGAGGEGSSSDKKFNNMEDVKNYVIELILSKIGPDTIDMVGKVLSYVGYFLFFVMACWAYVLIKIIVKTIFCKNKTVGLFFPRMFGWMPHVFFVGLPMFLIKYLPLFAEKIVASQPEMQESMNSIMSILEMIKLSVSSLTWISALCTVILMVLLIFYWPMRRRAKKERKGK